MTTGDMDALAGRPLLEFQPAIDLATGRLLGFEALLRWAHPTHGLISPAVLIPWAEANGDIIELNAWVLAEACFQAHQWPSGIQLAVNCSIVQLREGEASLSVASALRRSGLNPDRLTVEVTEHTIADDRAAADLRALSELGVHLAVDDVGTMWSSLNSLRRFAIETVKIDAAFIANLESDEGMNRAIVDAIVHVGHSLAMSTVAEGVETAAQTAILREFGADVAQGYFFARPMCTADTLALASVQPRAVFALTEQPGSLNRGPLQPPVQALQLVGATADGGQGPRSFPIELEADMQRSPARGSDAENPDVDELGTDVGNVHPHGSHDGHRHADTLGVDLGRAFPLPGPGVRLQLDTGCWPDPHDASAASGTA